MPKEPKHKNRCDIVTNSIKALKKWSALHTPKTAQVSFEGKERPKTSLRGGEGSRAEEIEHISQGFGWSHKQKITVFVASDSRVTLIFSSQKERVKYWFGSIVCPLSELLLKQLNAQTTEMMDAGPIVAILCRQSMCFPKIRFLWQDFFSLSHNTKLFFWSKKIYLVLAVEEISEAEFYFKEVHKPEE